MDEMKQIMEALLITLPKDSIPKAREIDRSIRRVAREVGRKVPASTDVFALLSAQPNPLAAYLNAQADGLLGDLSATDRSMLQAACRLPRSDLHDIGVLSQGYWAVQG